MASKTRVTKKNKDGRNTSIDTRKHPFAGRHIKKYKCRDCGKPCYGLRCKNCVSKSGTPLSVRYHVKKYNSKKVKQCTTRQL